VTEKNLGKALRHSLALAAFSLAVSSSASAQTPQDYPMWCQGATGLALSSGQSISVHFLPEKGPANQIRSITARLTAWRLGAFIASEALT